MLRPPTPSATKEPAVVPRRWIMVSAMWALRLVLVLSCALVGARPLSAATPDPRPTPARVDRSGSLDHGFGAGGFVDSELGGPTLWQGLTVDDDGTIVAAGRWSDELVVARYDAAGVLDPTFGDAGLAIPPLPHGGNARAVTHAGGGDLVVVGEAYGDPENGFPRDVLVLRFDPDGQLDRGFGDDGIVTIDLGKDAEAGTAVVTQGSGRIVVLADSNGPALMSPSGSAALLGFRSDGRVDPTFGNAGRVELRGAADEVWFTNGMLRTGNGDLVVAVTSYDGDDFENSNYRTHLVRFDRDGNERWTTTVAGYAAGLALLADGTIIVDGAFTIGNVGASTSLLRFDGNGTLDTTLGEDGLITWSEDQPGLLAVDGQNRIVVASNAVSRHYSDGVRDESFGDDGLAEDSQFSRHHALVLQRDGKILTAGEVCRFDPKGGSSGCLARLVRYESDATQLCGDADGDETLSVTDGVTTLRMAALLPSTCSFEVCDVDGDGTMSVTDGVNVLRAVAGLSAELRCGVDD